MKMYTHAWLAFMAMKRLQFVDYADAISSTDPGKLERLKADAKSLVRWFKSYRDYVIEGAWYPDQVFKDMGSSHIIKYEPGADIEKPQYKHLPDSIEMGKQAKQSTVYKKAFTIKEGNLADRCEAISHDIVDNLKMLRTEDKGCPISPTNNHIAMRFFIQSHYIADCHMPLHCDVRPFSSGKDLHGKIEEKWEDAIKKTYRIDKDNNRFFYDPDGYPLLTDKPDPLMLAVEEEIVKRGYLHSWGTKNKSTWDYMSAVSEYSYLKAYRMIPFEVSKTDAKDVSWDDFLKMEGGVNFSQYSREILADAVDSIARIWLHVWARYREWVTPYKKEG